MPVQQTQALFQQYSDEYSGSLKVPSNPNHSVNRSSINEHYIKQIIGNIKSIPWTWRE